MDTRNSTYTSILIATDNVTDAALVKNLLRPEFERVFITTDLNKSSEDYVRYMPDVLVLAFNTLKKTEQYYLELGRLCDEVHQPSRRTVVLCNLEEVRQVYELCKKDYFDDYILFWPMTHDSSRLPMTIHHALRDVTTLKNDEPSAAEFAAQVRHLSELEKTLETQITQGSHHIEVVSHAIEHAEQKISSAMDELSRQIISSTNLDFVNIKKGDELEKEISHFKREEVQPHFNVAIESTRPLKQWAQKLRQECEPFLESARVLNSMAEHIRPTVMVVDDNEAQRIIISKLLEAENYNLLFARDGIEALNILCKKRPDIILMDVMMPNMNGIETMRRLKAIPHLSGTPVIMITGKNEEEVVVECINAGAVDFVVKPFVHANLIDKIDRALNSTII
jgi:CheY-like chemotaxis protein